MSVYNDKSGTKAVLQIESEINDFLHYNSEFLDFKRSLKDCHSTEDFVKALIKKFNEYLKTIEPNFCIQEEKPFGFFWVRRYINLQVKYKLPYGQEEQCPVGVLFAHSTESDVMNMRIWNDTTSLSVRFNNEYIYGDTYNSCQKTYKYLTIPDIRKTIIKKRMYEIMNECQDDIKQTDRDISRLKKHKGRVIQKLKDVEQWRI